MGEKQEDGVTTAVFKFDMHCSGCAKKVAKHIKKIQGVESVNADNSTSKLVVTGKMDPLKLKEKVEEKTKKTVELVSQQPIKPAKEAANGGGDEKKSDDKKPEEKKSEEKANDKKPEEKKSEVKSDDKKPEDKEKEKEKPKEPPVATVQFKTRVHCDGCKDKIKKIVSKYQGVQDVNVDLQKDLITAKGTMNINKLLPYLNLKLKRTVELVPTKKDDGAGGDKKESSGGDKKPKEATVAPEKSKDGGGDKSEKAKEASGDKKESGSSEASASKDNTPRMEVNKMEHYPTSYDNRYAQVYQPMPQGNGYGYYQAMPQGNGYGYQPMPQGNGYGYQPMPQGNEYGYQPMPQGNGYGHQVPNYMQAPEYSQAPQMFSDENPNACSVM